MSHHDPPRPPQPRPSYPTDAYGPRGDFTRGRHTPATRSAPGTALAIQPLGHLVGPGGRRPTSAARLHGRAEPRHLAGIEQRSEGSGRRPPATSRARTRVRQWVRVSGERDAQLQSRRGRRADARVRHGRARRVRAGLRWACAPAGGPSLAPALPCASVAFLRIVVEQPLLRPGVAAHASRSSIPAPCTPSRVRESRSTRRAALGGGDARGCRAREGRSDRFVRFSFHLV